MKLVLANDHAAVEMKWHVLKYLQGKGHEVINLGIDTVERTDYPDWAEKAANMVASGEVDRGVLICGTGMGISLAANKVRGIRCACVSEPVTARMSRAHNDCNMVSFGARIIGEQMAEEILDQFLNTEHEGGRHAERVAKIMEIERRQG